MTRTELEVRVKNILRDCNKEFKVAMTRAEIARVDSMALRIAECLAEMGMAI